MIISYFIEKSLKNRTLLLSPQNLQVNTACHIRVSVHWNKYLLDFLVATVQSNFALIELL